MKQINIILPKKYNNGDLIDPEKFERTQEELIEKFGGITVFDSVRGLWKDEEGQLYADENQAFQIDITDDEPLSFFSEYKGVLKQRFDQKEIYITISPIERL